MTYDGRLSCKESDQANPQPLIPMDGHPFEEKAQQRLANYLCVDPSKLRCMSGRIVTWPNGHLGLKPDGMATDALVKGYQFIFRKDTIDYCVHTSGDLDHLRVRIHKEESLVPYWVQMLADMPQQPGCQLL